MATAKAAKVAKAAARRVRHDGPTARLRIAEMIDAAQPVHDDPPRPLFRELPPATPFPVAALGGVLRPAAEAIEAITRAPVAIAAQSVLAAATLAVQAHADVTLPTGQKRPVSAFFLTIAASGERKSACDDEALWPVRKREAGLRAEHDAAIDDYRERPRRVGSRPQESPQRQGEPG